MNIDDFIFQFKNQLEDIDTKITPETDYANAEFWDSLTSMVIKTMIEDEYSTDLDIQELNEFNSIQALFDFIVSSRK